METVPSVFRRNLETSNSLRHVTIFTTPAGATSKRFTTLATLSPALRHWGLIFQDQHDFERGDGLCIELDVENGHIFPKQTRWLDRQQEDNGQGKFRYANTDRFSFWDDDKIEWCVRNICNEQMKGTYDVLDRNCQVLVNLVLTRIVEGGAFNLGQTLGHVFSRKSTQERLFDSSEIDHGSGAKLITSKTPIEPKWSVRDAILAQTASSSCAISESDTAASGPRSALVDLSEADRPDGPLSLDEVRQVAKFWAQEPRQYGIPTSVRIQNPIDLYPQITGYIKSMAHSANTETGLQRLGEEYAQTQKSGPITPEAREAAVKADKYFRSYYHNHVSMMRQFATRTAAMAPYLDPKVPPDVRDEKARRLFALNTDALRQARVQSQVEYRNHLARGEGFLAMNKAREERTGVVPPRVDEIAPIEGCPECSELNMAGCPQIACFTCFGDAYYDVCCGDEEKDESKQIAAVDSK